ncbi:MAG: helix-turn-helix domain-containing protein [Ilumatobacter sp.]|uniref:helix-turn-helix domain-containing protein n=1 Tax=Ilumatobacter sp. TaxID=1967498 RepID=UPI00391B4425
MIDVQVIDEIHTAATMLDPIRARVLAELATPGSSTTVAKALGEPRQKINYHLRALEEAGLVELVEERPRRGLTERVMVASARSYVLSPEVLGRSAADPARTDRLSSSYLLALASRLIREVSTLMRRAHAAGQPLATLAIDTELKFANAADRAAFTSELTDAVATLAARYHSAEAVRGRWHRVVLAAHPIEAPITPTSTERSTTP